MVFCLSPVLWFPVWLLISSFVNAFVAKFLSPWRLKPDTTATMSFCKVLSLLVGGWLLQEQHGFFSQASSRSFILLSRSTTRADISLFNKVIASNFSCNSWTSCLRTTTWVTFSALEDGCAETATFETASDEFECRTTFVAGRLSSTTGTLYACKSDSLWQLKIGTVEWWTPLMTGVSIKSGLGVGAVVMDTGDGIDWGLVRTLTVVSKSIG